MTGYQILQEETGVKQVSIGVIGKRKMLQLSSVFHTLGDFPILLGTYREASTSANIFYQVISFYKVLEGVRASRRRHAERRRSLGLCAATYPDEVVPDPDSLPYGPDVKAALRPYSAKRFGWIIDQVRDDIRAAIAHLKPQEIGVNPDAFSDQQRCEKVVPVLRYVARRMLENELRAHAELESIAGAES